MTDTGVTRNQLAAEPSLYLRQHANDPVHWYPWNAAALKLAKDLDRPIFLSIGYSACHWCHVMATESFSDPAVAEILNREFISIKVDREERPDLDRVYQVAQQLITQRGGGWPLSMFLTPAGELPFFGGTYFPRAASHGMPAFTDLLIRVSKFYRDDPNKARDQGQSLQAVFDELEPAELANDVVMDTSAADSARQELATRFDPINGGFSEAPKFPNFCVLTRLLEHWRTSANSDEPDVQALYMVALTLKRMAAAGVFDQLGGGFFRYAIDAAWQIPHFEKMMADNAFAMMLYSDLYAASADDDLKQTLIMLSGFMIREFASETGAFHSSLDADSEGVEGGYYLWNRAEINKTLGDQYSLFASAYGVDEPANVARLWHLGRRRDDDYLAETSEQPVHHISQALAESRQRLLDSRKKRTAPVKDTRIITSWNALCACGFARMALACDDTAAAEHAIAVANFLADHHVVDDRLIASSVAGSAGPDGFLDDYAFTLWALLATLELRFDHRLFNFATFCAAGLLDKFEDNERGGFFFTPNNKSPNLHRSRPFNDDALPSGNAMAARALTRFGFLVGEPRYLEAAERTLRAGWVAMRDYPHGHSSLISALGEFQRGTDIVIIRGELEESRNWARAINHLYSPWRMTLALDTNASHDIEFLQTKPGIDEKTVAYVCRGTRCLSPLDNFEDLASELSEVSAGR